MISIKNLNKRYGNTKALHNLTIDFPQGEVIGLLGPNGSGKTTLIKIIMGLIRSYSGKVEIDGYKPGKETKAMISYLPDIFMLKDFKTISNAMDYYEGIFEDFNREKTNNLLKELALDSSMETSSLSKGMMEKFHLAMVLGRDARYYILDEPIGGVDLVSRDEIISTIISEIDEDSTMIIATHMVGEIEKILDSVAFISQGEILELAKTDDIREDQGLSVEDKYREVFGG